VSADPEAWSCFRFTAGIATTSASDLLRADLETISFPGAAFGGRDALSARSEALLTSAAGLVV